MVGWVEDLGSKVSNRREMAAILAEVGQRCNDGGMEVRTELLALHPAAQIRCMYGYKYDPWALAPAGLYLVMIIVSTSVGYPVHGNRCQGRLT